MRHEQQSGEDSRGSQIEWCQLHAGVMNENEIEDQRYGVRVIDTKLIPCFHFPDAFYTYSELVVGIPFGFVVWNV